MAGLQDIGGILLMVLVLFITIVFIAVMAPFVGQVGGWLYETLFVVLAFGAVFAGVIGFSRREG